MHEAWRHRPTMPVARCLADGCAKDIAEHAKHMRFRQREKERYFLCTKITRAERFSVHSTGSPSRYSSAFPRFSFSFSHSSSTSSSLLICDVSYSSFDVWPDACAPRIKELCHTQFASIPIENSFCKGNGNSMVRTNLRRCCCWYCCCCVRIQSIFKTGGHRSELRSKSTRICLDNA